MARLAIRVIPKAGADKVAGLRADEVVVRVKAAPDAGKANASVCKVIASFLGIAPGSVEIVRGHTSRHKILEVQGLSAAEISQRLEALDSLG